MEIIKQLQEESLFLKQGVDCPLTRNEKVITSPSAAGYEDFMKQLVQNKSVIIFITSYPDYARRKNGRVCNWALDKGPASVGSMVLFILRGGGLPQISIV
jgi:exodeoxyribonuclease VII large subunit